MPSWLIFPHGGDRPPPAPSVLCYCVTAPYERAGKCKSLAISGTEKDCGRVFYLLCDGRSRACNNAFSSLNTKGSESQIQITCHCHVLFLLQIVKFLQDQSSPIFCVVSKVSSCPSQPFAFLDLITQVQYF